ncbi:ISAs1 family transposase [Methylobacterium aquaticum]|uniref:ISAs1 family transposase n=1 Tax=Methylobacterium aquaticum TaxID=270351 RepID=UPI0011AE537A|nr:ISAs1 family transposase [Methylobacterium aquaticum]
MPKSAPDMTFSASVVEKGHGRIETRRLSVSRECVAYLGWPGAAQICRIERIRETKGRISREIAYAVTSLTPEQADPDALLALWRDHWLIKNRLHWRRDVILREDDSRIRTGASPQALAAMRNAMLHLVKDAPGPLRAIREAFAENRLRAIKAAQSGLL